jgi:hypothetical protein
MNRFFRGLSINRFVIGPLHYLLSRSDFGVEVAEIFVIENRLPDSTRPQLVGILANTINWFISSLQHCYQDFIFFFLMVWLLIGSVLLVDVAQRKVPQGGQRDSNRGHLRQVCVLTNELRHTQPMSYGTCNWATPQPHIKKLIIFLT